MGGAFVRTNGHHAHHKLVIVYDPKQAERLWPAFNFKNFVANFDLDRRPSGFEVTDKNRSRGPDLNRGPVD